MLHRFVSYACSIYRGAKKKKTTFPKFYPKIPVTCVTCVTTLTIYEKRAKEGKTAPLFCCGSEGLHETHETIGVSSVNPPLTPPIAKKMAGNVYLPSLWGAFYD